MFLRMGGCLLQVSLGCLLSCKVGAFYKWKVKTLNKNLALSMSRKHTEIVCLCPQAVSVVEVAFQPKEKCI